MSKFSGYAIKSEAEYRKHENEQVINFMNGVSYTTNPLLELELACASSIFGESSYYKNQTDCTNSFIESCDAALDYDFKGVLELAKGIRNTYNMRLNSALIVVRACMHKNRQKFNEENKNFMSESIKELINIPTDIWNQFELWMFFNKSKNKLPSILKRVWASKLSSTKKYQLAKYKNLAHIKDLVRISHANSKDINELMKTGTIQVKDEESTWEKFRSQKMPWKDILQKTYIPHMAILRNLKGIFSECKDAKVKNQVLTVLKAQVSVDKQFPFRYYTALKEIQKSDVPFKPDIETALNLCLDMSMRNFPKLEGKTICLSDNSGSAWGALTSEYGSTLIGEINNLSAVITAYNSDEGEVGIFGDKLGISRVNKRDGILSQLQFIQEKYNRSWVGAGTENGIWLFFDKAIKEKIHYDNIFIYSDQQAGNGGLFGIDPKEYINFQFKRDSRYIDVLALVQKYRGKVNSKVNVFSIQTAGYDNSVLPENLYRTSILTGWTGKEVLYAKTLIDIWNKAERFSENTLKQKEKSTFQIKSRK